jgi:hypothetical protein
VDEDDFEESDGSRLFALISHPAITLIIIFITTWLVSSYLIEHRSLLFYFNLKNFSLQLLPEMSDEFIITIRVALERKSTASGDVSSHNETRKASNL